MFEQVNLHRLPANRLMPPWNVSKQKKKILFNFFIFKTKINGLNIIGTTKIKEQTKVFIGN